ncbi:VCBS repeat-containing protein [Brevundimonas sp.]|uniref:FG-GAP repeat domain-containing protein n=1 Tax=Brevundimonas sp. TaxID=1871086 RepID=UPI00261DC966|nr:VCBS repeat-containing protein [Brevundimonas sp.]
MTFSAGQLIGESSAFPAIGDFNNDGLLEPFGFLNLGDWTFNIAPSLALDLIVAGYQGRINRDNRVLDLDGDGNLDVVWNVYSDANVTGSFTLILFGDGAGGFSRVEERPDIIGFGETIVAADFNNDGLVDIYSPVYTHLLGVDSAYLLLNEGGGVLGDNVAEV